MTLHRRCFDARLLTLLMLAISVAAIDSTSFAQAGWTPFGELPGAEAYQAMSRNGRRIGGGGQVRDVRFDDTAVYFMTGTGWQKVDLASGERTEADPKTLPDKVRGAASGRRGGRRAARGRQLAEEPSPDESLTAIHRNHNVWLRDANGDEIPVTIDGTEANRFGTACWVYGEELDQNSAMWWSPDGAFLAFYAFDVSPTRDYYLVDGLTKLRTGVMKERYPKAGDPNPIAGLRILDVETGKIATVDVGPETDQYVYAVQWTPDSSELLFNRTNRHQNHLDVLAADPNTGATRVVVTETQDTWQRNRPLMRFLEDGRRFIWESERTGWKHFELRDLDGSLVSPLSTGEFPAESIVKLDEEAEVLWFTACSSETPVNPQLHRVNLDGSNERRVTTADLHHSRFTIAADGRAVTAVRQAIDHAPETALYSVDGGEIAVLASGDDSGLEASGLEGGELIRFTSPDGITPLHAFLHLPAHADRASIGKYPLVIDVYGGPESRGPSNTWSAANPLCELGFAVAKIENRGTVARGKAFEGATYLNLGGPDLDDQVAGVNAILAAHPEIDPERVGMTGHSYGGYMSALAMVRHPDVFAAAVAGAPVTDWRNYDTIYTERYMRTPKENAEGYDAGSAVKLATKLKGDLLFLHGMEDDNVHPSNTFQMAAKLQDRDIPFEMIMFPTATHGIGSAAYRSSKWSFLQEHLGAATTANDAP